MYPPSSFAVLFFFVVVTSSAWGTLGPWRGPCLTMRRGSFLLVVFSVFFRRFEEYLLTVSPRWWCRGSFLGYHISPVVLWELCVTSDDYLGLLLEKLLTKTVNADDLMRWYKSLFMSFWDLASLFTLSSNSSSTPPAKNYFTVVCSNFLLDR